MKKWPVRGGGRLHPGLAYYVRQNDTTSKMDVNRLYALSLPAMQNLQQQENIFYMQ